jgi:hypothetical protein
VTSEEALKKFERVIRYGTLPFTEALPDAGRAFETCVGELDATVTALDSRLNRSVM